MFDLYDQFGNLAEVASAASNAGLRSKRHHFKSGRIQGGRELSVGQIHHILTNPVYLGRIRHKEQVWPGRHPAILDQDLWDRVQTRLQLSARRQRGQRARGETALLIGKLRDETGDRLTPTHSVKSGRRHRYYVSNRLISGGPDPCAWRLPAVRLETLVADLIADHLDAAIGEHRLLGSLELGGQHEVTAKARLLADRVRTGERDVLRDLLASGSIGPQTLSLTLRRDCLAAELGILADDITEGIEQIAREIQLRRRGVEAKLVVGDTPAAPDAVLLRTLRDAHLWTAALRDGVPLGDIAREAGHHDVYIRTRSQLAFLSPRIQRAIADGSIAPEITLQHLMTVTLPVDWQDQERLCRLA